MKNINSKRVFHRNSQSLNEDGDYVLYWMQTNRRLNYNFALEYAVAWANKLNKPLVIYEALNADYRWNSARTHAFILEGMQERHAHLLQQGFHTISFVETFSNEGKGLMYKLSEPACVVISDEHPVFMARSINERVSNKFKQKFITVDANGLIPMACSAKDPYSAYLFRKTMQHTFAEAFQNPPLENPLLDLAIKKSDTSERILNQLGIDDARLEQSWSTDTILNKIKFEHNVTALSAGGTRQQALHHLEQFIQRRIRKYDTDRNHPDTPAASGLSPWLHFGTISTHEIIQAVIDTQNDWSVKLLQPNGGKNRGFFQMSEYAESFLDELVTWREVGFHFAHHRADYDQFDSLPDWALKTMDEHRHDPRPHLYTLEQLANAQTHDELWNAAQRQLVEEGVIHNYLRMLWGKKVIEWSPDYETALNNLIELNNIYAIDGRDPNSYSGIFWCFGRFDRAWTERPIFGKLRYMASANTQKKIKLKGYLKRWSATKQLNVL